MHGYITETAVLKIIGTNMCTVYLIMIYSISSFSFGFTLTGVDTASHLSHLTLSSASSLTPTTFMSSFTPSRNLLFERPLRLLPVCSSILLLTFTPLYHLSLASLALFPTHLT
ncbi:hypothetical protein ATANTOWER_017114 [Ataeniobius toweri]|uniref:Uncharacterized protein n=1 Tax=Ataeniobius toweri TaxID=208326 RepID=A0ABU7CBQ6_9TELE|nr:hypothetical protein [Ataeniobius toweri]